MRKIRCYDCGRSYDYDEDCFCPNCGAFNQFQRSLRIGADGSVVRVDGINESNHANSFVHQELHEEKRERRRIGLDKGVQRIQRAAPKSAAAKQAYTSAGGIQTGRRTRQQKGNPISVAIWVIILIILLNLFSRILFFL